MDVFPQPDFRSRGSRPVSRPCKNVVLLLLLAAFGLAIFSGCSSNPPKRRGIDLSDAASQAKKPPEQQKTLKEDPPEDERREPARNTEEGASLGLLIPSGEPDSSYIGGPAAYAPGQAPPEVEATSLTETLKEPGESSYLGFNLEGGFGGQGKSAFNGFGLVAAGIGVRIPRWRMRGDINLFYQPADLAKSSTLAAAFKNEFELGFDGRVRYSFTPAHTLLGVFALGGIRFGLLSWDYANPIDVEDEYGNIEVIHGDMLTVFSVYIGTGVGLMQTSAVHVSASVSVGYKMYSNVTEKGFDNNLIGDRGFALFLIDLSFGSIRA